uniref:YtxH domain-containing protein n=1 Tax=Staphylococcus aureus TaxID=1280 RepID=UPI0021B1B194
YFFIQNKFLPPILIPPVIPPPITLPHKSTPQPLLQSLKDPKNPNPTPNPSKLTNIKHQLLYSKHLLQQIPPNNPQLQRSLKHPKQTFLNTKNQP